MSDGVLLASAVVKAFGRRSVLRGVSLEVCPGEMVGIVGENGAGKSTLLRIIVGVERPDEGSVVVRGRIGYCPQEAQVFSSLSVRENFAYFGTAYGIADYECAAERLLKELQFAGYERDIVFSLSGGTQQKLNLAIALLHDPAVVILDEPYTGFDWETYLRFWEIVERLKSAGKAVVVVSHFVYDRERFERILTLRDGILQ